MIKTIRCFVQKSLCRQSVKFAWNQAQVEYVEREAQRIEEERLRQEEERAVHERYLESWEGFLVEILPAKFEWAKSFDLRKIAAKAMSNVEKVDKEAGFPSLWLKLGHLCENGKPALKQFLIFGEKLLKADALQSSALGSRYRHLLCQYVLNPKEYWDYRDVVLEVVHVHTNIFRHISSFNAYDYFRIIGDLYREGYLKSWSSEDYGNLASWQNAILSKMVPTDRRIESFVSFIHSLPGCHKGPGFLCPCSFHFTAVRKIEDLIKQKLDQATTSDEAFAVPLPNVRNPYATAYEGTVAERWSQRKQKKIDSLLQKEENNRVKAALSESA